MLTPRAREIAEAARTLLEEGGPEALSMRAVAASLGIQAPSIYKHHRDKEALETAIIADALDEVGDRFTDAVAGADDPLGAVADAYRRWALAHPHVYDLMMGRPLPRDRLAPGLEERPAAVLVAACAGDVDRARAAFAFAHGMVSLELADRFPPTADVDAAWRVGIDALRPAPAR